MIGRSCGRATLKGLTKGVTLPGCGRRSRPRTGRRSPPDRAAQPAQRRWRSPEVRDRHNLAATSAGPPGPCPIHGRSIQHDRSRNAPQCRTATRQYRAGAGIRQSPREKAHAGRRSRHGRSRCVCGLPERRPRRDPTRRSWAGDAGVKPARDGRSIMDRDTDSRGDRYPGRNQAAVSFVPTHIVPDQARGTERYRIENVRSGGEVSWADQRPFRSAVPGRSRGDPKAQRGADDSRRWPSARARCRQ